MARFYNKNTEIEITDFNKDEALLKYDRRQPIFFICPACNKVEHRQMNMLWKRNGLLYCYDCYKEYKSKTYKCDEPLSSSSIQIISKPISPS